MVNRFYTAGRDAVLSKKNLIIVSTALTAFTLTFRLSAQDKKPEWKDRAEYDLYDTAQKDANPTTRLATLEKWKQTYPMSDFADGRKDMILTTYQQLNQQRQVIDTAQDILKDKPNNFHAIS